MAEKGELKVGDMVRYWARTSSASRGLDGSVGTVTSIPSNTVGDWVYVDWLPALCKEKGPYGANLENLDKIELLP